MTTSDLDRTLTEAATLLSRSGVFDREDLIEVPHDYYAIGDEIARGGMGQISTARDLRSGRIVAIKEVLSEVLTVYPEVEREEVLARFCREAILTARLEHPSIVPVYEIGRFGEVPFFAMKRVTGEPLDIHMKAAESFEERLAMLPKIAAVAEAIAYAHTRGVIHRDLKPSNVLVGEFGETLVIDWGLAKDIGAIEEDQSRRHAGSAGDLADSIDETLEGSVIGTPQYMPPEQARGEAVDRRADVYALGALLYHVLAGKPPYPINRGAKINPIADVLRRVRDEAPTPLEELAPETPRDLLSIVTKAMARDRDDRYADAGEMVTDLTNFQRGQLVAVHDYSAAELIRRWLRKHRAALITAAVLLSILFGLAAWFVIENDRERDAANAAVNRWVSMFEQRGRAELHRGDVATAALILSEAYQQLPDDPGVRIMVADATRAITPLERVFRVTGGEVKRIAGVGKHIAAFVDGQLMMFDLLGNRLASRPLEPPNRMEDTPDGRLVLAYQDRIVVIDENGKQLIEINPTAPFVSFAVDPAGRVVGVGSNSGMVEIFDLRTGERRGRRNFTSHKSMMTIGILALAFHPKTEEVVVTTPMWLGVFEDHTLEKLRLTIRAKEYFVSADLSASHPRMVLGTTLGKAILADTATGESIAELTGHIGFTRGVFNATGERIITVGGTVTRLFEAKEGKLVSDLSGWTAESTAVMFDRASDRFAIAGLDGTMRVYDAKAGRERRRLVGHGRSVRALSFMGDRLISMSRDGIVKVWDASVDLRTKHVPMKTAPYLLERGDRILTFSPYEPVRLWSVSEQRVVAALSSKPTRAAAMSPGGGLIATADGLFDGHTGALRTRLDLGSLIGLSVNDDGRIAAINENNKIDLLDPQGRVIRRLEPDRRVGRSYFIAGGLLLMPASGALLIYDMDADSYRVFEAVPSTDKLVSAAVRGDGARVAISTLDGTSLWDIASGELLGKTAAGAPGLSYHPHKDVIALGTPFETILWRPPAEPEILTTPRRGLAGRPRFSRSGRMLVSTDSPIKIWEVETRAVLIERDVGVTASRAYLANDDRTLVVTSQSGLDFWDISPETRSAAEIRELVADKVPRDFEVGRGVISRPAPMVGSVSSGL